MYLSGKARGKQERGCRGSAKYIEAIPSTMHQQAEKGLVLVREKQSPAGYKQ